MGEDECGFDDGADLVGLQGLGEVAFQQVSSSSTGRLKSRA